MRRRVFKKQGKTGLPFFLPAFLAVCLLPDGRALAAAKQFVPKYEEFQADFGIQGIYERDRISGDNNRTSQDFLMQEGISTKGYGYIYSSNSRMARRCSNSLVFKNWFRKLFKFFPQN